MGLQICSITDDFCSAPEPSRSIRLALTSGSDSTVRSVTSGHDVFLSSPQSAPWPVSVSAASWQFGRCPLRPRNASSRGQCSAWWRHLSAPHQHCSRNGKTCQSSLKGAKRLGGTLKGYLEQSATGRKAAGHLQWTAIGPSWPNCSLVLCTWPMKSMKPSPDFGTPCSGQSVNWNWRTVLDWPSWGSGQIGNDKRHSLQNTWMNCRI